MPTRNEWLARDDESGMVGEARWEVGCSVGAERALAVRVAVDDGGPGEAGCLGVGYSIDPKELRLLAAALLRHADLLEQLERG